MTGETPALSTALKQMREEFDLTFAAPAARDTALLEEFISVRIGEDRFAMRIRELVGIEAPKPILPLSTDRFGLLGLAGIRGRLVCVYSLALLLGRQEAARERHWLVLVGRDQPLGLSFTELQGYVRVPPGEISAGGEAHAHPFAHEAIRSGVAPYFVLDLPKIITSIQSGPVKPG